MEKDKSLEGLKYDSLELNDNVHKMVGKVNTLINGKVGEVDIDEKAIWLITGLGYLDKDTDDKLLSGSLDDTIILSKSALIEFINSRSVCPHGKVVCPSGGSFVFNEVEQELQCGCRYEDKENI
jgi:hypothetical protein